VPVVLANPNFPNQVGANPASKPYVTQMNAGQMIREVCQWNPNVDPQSALRMINNRYRAMLRSRSWYGMKVRGIIQVGSPYSVGTCTVANGQNTVQGIGTAWTPSLIGQQFRTNFTQPYQTITQVDTVNQVLTTDLPYAGASTTSGYLILEAYFALDANIRRINWAVNQQMGWQMKVGALPVECVNSWDTWRTYNGYSTHFVTRPPTPSGQYQIEIWPSPFMQQVFPFEAWAQPADMQLDSDSPLPFIDADILVIGATADALRFRPKQNSYYDPGTAISVAGTKEEQFKLYIQQNELLDNDIDQRDVTWDYGEGNENTFPGGFGSAWAQNHE
jgi:hypothetical protein